MTTESRENIVLYEFIWIRKICDYLVKCSLLHAVYQHVSG